MDDIVFYKRALNSMRDMVLIKGPESKLLWANKAFLDYYGMTEEELRGIIDSPQSNPDDTLQYVRDDKFVFDNKVNLNIPSEPVTNSKGEINYFHTIKSPIFEDGNMIQSIGVTRLIEDSSILEQDLKELDAKVFTAPLRSIINTLPIATMLLDHDLRIIKANNKWCKSFGDEPTNLNTNLEHHYKKLSDLVLEAMLCLKEDREFEKIIEIEHASFKKFYDFKVTPWKYPNGTVGGVMIVGTDVTSIKVAESKLAKANDNLSNLNEELSQFAYRTSHDLKAPLATIKGLTEFILEDVDSGSLTEAKKNIGMVHNQATKLETLVVDILNLAKSDLQKQDYNNVNIYNLLNDIRESYSDLIREKNVVIESDIMPDLEIWSQETRLRQILGNLIANSIKYSDPKKNKKFVKISCDVKEHIQFCIRDNGVGISEQNQEKIFDMFSRFNPALSDGSGLGMSIVKKNVDALNGKIQIESNQTGTSLFISLPKFNPRKI